ncbi:helicase associated domain-containing protein [Streptomyces sp. NPDC004044]
MHQIIKYAHDYGQHTAYRVIYNITDKLLELPADGTPGAGQEPETADSHESRGAIVTGSEDGDEDQEQHEERNIKLGAWINNQRTGAATLSPERVEQLSTIGMSWT